MTFRKSLICHVSIYDQIRDFVPFHRVPYLNITSFLCNISVLFYSLVRIPLYYPYSLHKPRILSVPKTNNKIIILKFIVKTGCTFVRKFVPACIETNYVSVSRFDESLVNLFPEDRLVSHFLSQSTLSSKIS